VEPGFWRLGFEFNENNLKFDNFGPRKISFVVGDSFFDFLNTKYQSAVNTRYSAFSIWHSTVLSSIQQPRHTFNPSIPSLLLIYLLIMSQERIRSKKRKASSTLDKEDVNNTLSESNNIPPTGSSDVKPSSLVDKGDEDLFSKDIDKANSNSKHVDSLGKKHVENDPKKGGREHEEKLKSSPSSFDAKKNKSSRESNSYDNMHHVIVMNDGKHESLVRLVGLKNLFAKQLPKMPKDYIVRLVFDRRHKSLAILSDDPAVKGTDEEIIGGICYRAYHDMRFGEIAFCAVNGNQQVKVRKRKYIPDIMLMYCIGLVSF
jgi:hypothetical protein